MKGDSHRGEVETSRFKTTQRPPEDLDDPVDLVGIVYPVIESDWPRRSRHVASERRFLYSIPRLDITDRDQDHGQYDEEAGRSHTRQRRTPASRGPSFRLGSG